jgi:L-alanine-DL-glutamate epimerase-like enolase superfamily enzyme
MPKEQVDDTAWLRERSPLPLIADESVQRLGDVARARGVFHGINIKLMKCTGLREAHKMIILARALGLRVMLGCMTETSCAISAAAQLSPLVDWADLDGALLIKNDLFDGVKIVDGKITLGDRAGDWRQQGGRYSRVTPTGLELRPYTIGRGRMANACAGFLIVS